MKKINNQIHYINPKCSWKKIETLKLSELFQEYNISKQTSQIIRFNKEVYPKVISWLSKWNLNLFNKRNPEVNNILIENFNNENHPNFKWLILEMYQNNWISQPIIQESSIEICDILEMSDKKIKEIIEQDLYKKWIWEHRTFDDFKKWFIEEFEWNRITEDEFKKMSEMFFRKIKLTK